MVLCVSLVTLLTLAMFTNAAPLGAAMEGQRVLQLPDGLNNVPMMGKKDAYPRDVPSFTSGFLNPTYPEYLRNRQSKRDADVPATWHLGKRAPWALERSSWVDSLFKPSPSNSAHGKRSLSAWTSPWANSNKMSAGKRTPISNEWSSPQGFRFNQAAGLDILTRKLMYKRADDSTDDITKRNLNHITIDNSPTVYENQQEQSQVTDEHESDSTENSSLDPVQQAAVEEDPQPEVETHKGIPPSKMQTFTPNFWMVPPANRFNPWVFDVMNAG